MKNENLIEVARKEKQNSTVWLIIGTVILIFSVVWIVGFYYIQRQYWNYLLIAGIVISAWGFILFVMGIWDKLRPEVIISFDDKNTSLKVFCRGKWHNIPFDSILSFTRENHKDNKGIFHSYGTLTFTTTKREFRIKNIQNIVDVWLKIKCIFDECE